MAKKKVTEKRGAKNKYGHIDGKEVEQLAGYGCTNAELSDFYTIPESSLRRNFGEFLTKGRTRQKIRLRQVQMAAAEEGSVAMQIWLGKQLLNQKDRQDITSNDETVKPSWTINVVDPTKE